MTQKKREQVISHLRFLRQELREMHIGIENDGLSQNRERLEELWHKRRLYLNY